MKLIRLTNNNNTRGVFDNLFNEDIIIDANSKIALHSLTAEIDTEQFIVDSQNDCISYRMAQTDDYRTLHAVHGMFNSSTFGNLFNDLSIKMNKLLRYQQNEIGMQWTWRINTANKKTSISAELGTYIKPEDTDMSIQKYVFKEEVNYVNLAYGRAGGTVFSNDAYMYFNAPNCKGVSTLRGRVYDRFDDSANTNGGFIIGYQDTPPNTQTSSIDKADILFGIRALKADTGANGGFYNVIINGIETPTTTKCRIIGQKYDSNDYVSIDTYGGKIYGNIYRTNEVITLFSYDYDHIKNLYPVIVFAGQNTVQSPCRLMLIRFTPDPYFNVSNTYVLEDSFGAIPSGGGSPSGSKKSIKFNDADLATFFGFRNTVLEQQTIDPNNRMNHTFTSDREFTPADFSDSFVFVLDNINIEAYDGLNNGHLNILHTIVQADIVRQRLVYTAPYPLFLNVKNPYKISLRRIRGRLLREDLSEVALTGIAQITLLIDTQNN